MPWGCCRAGGREVEHLFRDANNVRPPFDAVEIFGFCFCTLKREGVRGKKREI